MDEFSFLRYLNETTNASGPNGRYILRFSSPGQYSKITALLQEEQEHYPNLGQIRISPLLGALLCPEGILDPKTLRDQFGVIAEKDEPVNILAASALDKELSSGLPWGIRRIGASEAWSVSTGHQIRIGVIDTGADFSHPDLRSSLSRGVNLLSPMSPPHDDNGHGTHIAGTIAASGGSKGMMGVAPRALIHPVKAFDHNGSAYVSDIVLGIDWCVQNRMHIINMSFGMKSKSQALLNTVRKAYNAGIVVVASSGNDKKSNGADYPARYPYTISVGATGRDGRIAPFSNRGSRIDIYAPGEKVRSCWLGDGYKEMNGTSMATSHVSGAIALLLAQRPGLSPAEIKRRLRRTARPLPSGAAGKSKTSHPPGEVNASRLLRGGGRKAPAAGAKKPAGKSS